MPATTADRLLYIGSHYQSLSETFSTTLVTGLADLGWNVTVGCGELHPGPAHQRVVAVETRHRVVHRTVDRWRRLYTRTLRLDPKEWKLRRSAAEQIFGPLMRDRDPQVVLIDFGYNAVVALPTCRARGLPLVVHFHGSDITSSLSDAVYRGYLLELFDYGSAFIVASHHIKRLLILEGCREDKIQLIRLEASTDSVAGLDWALRRKETPSVAFLGRLTPKKHPVALVEAFRIAKEQVHYARLTIIGSGEELSRVKARVDKLRLTDAVDLVPGCPRPQALQRIASHWVYAQHSVTSIRGDQEGFALSLAEAALLELPVVSTWHNGIPEQVVDGETGYLVPEYDFQTMGARLAQLLGDASLCERLGANGRQRIAELCPPGKRAVEVDRLLQSIV